MLHVDEGALHAYLDGALDEYPQAEAERIREHLDACADCSARLEEERKLRSDAHAMLGLAAPEVDMPSLEELRAYVKRTRPVRPPAAVRMYRMGWAASIVLAVGAGWMLRGGQLRQSQLLESGDFEVRAPAMAPDGAQRMAPADADPLEETLAGAVSRDLMVEGEREQQASPARRVDAPVPSVTDDAVDFLDVAEPSAEAFANRAELPVDAVAKSAEQDVVASEAAPTEAVSGEVMPEAQAVITAGLDEAERLRAAGDHVAVAGAEQPQPDDVGLTALARQADSAAAGGGTASDVGAAEPDEDAERANERRRAESPVPMTLGLDRSGRAVESFAEDERKVEAEPLSSVPGYDVVSVTGVNEGTTFMGSRTVQRYDEVRTFEVFDLEPDVDPSALPALASGSNEVTLQTETGWIVLRGPLPEERLGELLALLFPEPI